MSQADALYLLRCEAGGHYRSEVAIDAQAKFKKWGMR